MNLVVSGPTMQDLFRDYGAILSEWEGIPEVVWPDELMLMNRYRQAILALPRLLKRNINLFLDEQRNTTPALLAVEEIDNYLSQLLHINAVTERDYHAYYVARRALLKKQEEWVIIAMTAAVDQQLSRAVDSSNHRSGAAFDISVPRQNGKSMIPAMIKKGREIEEMEEKLKRSVAAAVTVERDKPAPLGGTFSWVEKPIKVKQEVPFWVKKERKRGQSWK